MLLIRSGNRHNTIEFPQKAEVVILKAKGIPVLTNMAREIEKAFKHPVGHASDEGVFLSRPVHGRVAIAVTETLTSDNLEMILPSILTHLYQKSTDLKPNAVTIIVDERIKRTPEMNRFKKLFQKMIASGCRVIIHDPILQKITNLGTTRRGTPVWINSEFANADLKIVLSQIKPCPLFGFMESPLRMAHCCMSIDTIQSLKEMILPRAGEDKLPERHPVLDEFEEICHMVGFDGVLACLCNPAGEPIRIMAGEPVSLIREAEAVYQRHYCISVSPPFDIAVISFGPHHSERLPYLMQDSLLLAARVLKEGGNVLIMDDHTQRGGQGIFFDYICQSLSPAALIEGFIKSRNQSRTSNLGRSSQQSTSTDRNLEKIFGMAVIRHCQFRAADPSTVLAEWADEYENQPRIAVIPEAYGTFCYLD